MSTKRILAKDLKLGDQSGDDMVYDVAIKYRGVEAVSVLVTWRDTTEEYDIDEEVDILDGEPETKVLTIDLIEQEANYLLDNLAPHQDARSAITDLVANIARVVTDDEPLTYTEDQANDLALAAVERFKQRTGITELLDPSDEAVVDAAVAAVERFKARYGLVEPEERTDEPEERTEKYALVITVPAETYVDIDEVASAVRDAFGYANRDFDARPLSAEIAS